MKVAFGTHILDGAARQLLRGSEVIHLSPKAFHLLVLLVEARPAVVDRTALRQQLWPDTHVVAAALGNLVAEIRAALGSDATVVRTAHGVGYAFDGHARDLDPRAGPGGGPRHWLVWGERTIVLVRSTCVIGRDPACDVWIDAPGVSRRHARLQLPDAGLDDAPVIEDLDSTNGTDVNRRTIAGPTALDDGDAIGLGEATVIFRVWRHADAPTKRVRRSPR
ncbi:MAG: hypothetical protein ABS36_01570 [Acidobacteria bacterium SCN 69-37]|nr:MAG: hypothetical protein ABS36_01570 [Acidobacteria bacterium SCN 69-37]